MKQTVKNREKRALLKEAAADGRGNDSMMAHVAKGEIVVPVDLANHPQVKQMLQKGFEALGTTMEQYTVGHEKNSRNPETGEAEFFKLPSISIGGVDLTGTIIGAGVGYLVPGVGMAAGAKIGAGVDVARASATNAKLAREQAAQAQAQAIEEARKARESAAAEAQKSREATALEAQKARDLQAQQMQQSREQQSAALEQQKADAAARLEQTKLTAEQQAKLMQDLTAQHAVAVAVARCCLKLDSTQSLASLKKSSKKPCLERKPWLSQPYRKKNTTRCWPKASRSPLACRLPVVCLQRQQQPRQKLTPTLLIRSTKTL
jgi:flagellar biosynthesis GTPase FlhF